MADDEGIRGADALLAISKRLKAVDKDLRKEFHKALTSTVRPLIPKVRESARQSLPKRGGLNERIARKPYRAQTRTGEKTVGVRITGTKVDPRINDQGRVQHPVFGRDKSTVVQNVPAAKSYFDRTFEEAAPRARDELIAVLEDYARRLVQRGDTSP